MSDLKTMTETFDSINQWQRETFPDATVEGVLNHIEEEWKEFQTATILDNKIEEAVDLIILLSSYIDKASVGLDQTISGSQVHVDRKMRRNRARRWHIQTDGTGRHA